MNTKVSLPPNALPKQGPRHVGATEFARIFVTAQLSRQLPKRCIKAALTAGILWKGILAEYADYDEGEAEVIIRADDAADYLPAGEWAALSPAKRKEFRNAINRDWAARRKDLAMVIRFIKEQAASIDRGGDAFKEAFESNETEYLSTPIES